MPLELPGNRHCIHSIVQQLMSAFAVMQLLLLVMRCSTTGTHQTAPEPFTIQVPADHIGPPPPPPPFREAVNIAGCKIAYSMCPDPLVNFFYYPKENRSLAQQFWIDGPSPARTSDLKLQDTDFDPDLPTKLIIHGYNSGKDLAALVAIREEYFASPIHVNVLAVDWSELAEGPCYPAAVWNAQHIGQCLAPLVEEVRQLGSEYIHVIGFSLGAHVANYLANALLPYKLDRITGLDPAMPGFITASAEHKLDRSDAKFVDVLHTNAFVQGKAEEIGHVDFYLNGGVVQPGCWVENRFFACNHHRAPIYFAESINTKLGFWGWPCSSYLNYLMGNCPPVEPQIIMGENVDESARGVHLVITSSVSPYAVGKFTGPTIEIVQRSDSFRMHILRKYRREIMDFIRDEDELFDWRAAANPMDVLLGEHLFDGIHL